ncbi:MAG: hypothetical protein H8E61_08440 [Bacteroidetes bacterium]|nr:hypothetical protein [Bacteroidota bacterium]
MQDIIKSEKILKQYIEDQRFSGYDPYDTLNSALPLSKFGKWIPAIATQVQKRNPVNIRPLLGIQKGRNPKGIGLLLKAYCIRYSLYGEEKDRSIADQLFKWLLENTSKGYSGSCWGYNFGWTNPNGNLPAYTPSVVVTGFVVDGILAYYREFGDKTAIDVILSACEYILNDLPKAVFDEGICIGYTHLSKGCCYNASLLGAETLAKAYDLTQDKKYLEPAKSAVDYVLSRQKRNGVWNYSYNPENDTERKQIDFHQGFVLTSLINYIDHSGDNRPAITTAIKKGADFYRQHQFYPDGRSKWRYPKEWPVEIHNQAQGIITFSQLAEYDPQYLEFAGKILDFTIEYMQDKRGYFYYQKHPNYTNKISYMRWSQAWMLLAMMELIKNQRIWSR